MSQPWEPPGQQPPPAGETPAPAGGPQPTEALPPNYYPGYQGNPSNPGESPGLPYSPASAYPSYPAYPAEPANPYAPPPYAGGPPQAAPVYPGYQPYGAYQPYAAMPPTSGVTVITASVIQLVQSTFWLVVGIVLMVSAHNVSSFLDTSELDSETRAGARGALIGAGVLIVLVAGAMIALAILALRRVNGCRIASAVVQIVLGVLPLVGVLGAASSRDAASAVVSLLFVASCAAAAVLFFMPASARYCQRNAPRPPGY